MVKGTQQWKSSRGYDRVISIPQLPFGDSTMKPTLTLKELLDIIIIRWFLESQQLDHQDRCPRMQLWGREGGGGAEHLHFLPFSLLQKTSTWASKISTLDFQTPSLHSVMKACLHKRQQKVVWEFGLGFLMVLTLGWEKSTSQFKILVVGHNVKQT